LFISVEESLRKAVVDEYTKEGKGNLIEKELLMLRRSGVTTLEKWSELSNEKKQQSEQKKNQFLMNI
jgi:hypothetical protein